MRDDLMGRHDVVACRPLRIADAVLCRGKRVIATVATRTCHLRICARRHHTPGPTVQEEV